MSHDDESLRPFADALAGWLHERSEPPPPDFADVLARAEAMSEHPLPASLYEGIDPEDEALEDDDPVEDERDAELSIFAADLREHHERHLRDRELSPIPDAAPVAPVRWLPYALVAAAAAVLLAVFVPDWSSDARELGDGTPSAAERISTQGDSDGDQAVRREPKRTRTPVKPAPEPEGEPPLVEPDPGPELEATTAEATPRRERPTLEALEAEARAAWARGELDEAERLFRRVIRRAPRSSQAELAYGDLFSVAKQRSGATAQAKVWREYLGRFPKGRYADDARAGLCRSLTGDAQRTCWADYLQAHPHGTHAAKARTLVDEGTE